MSVLSVCSENGVYFFADDTLGQAPMWAARLFTNGPLREITSVVVFCAFKELTETVAATLRGAGISSAAYHAGKSHQV